MNNNLLADVIAFVNGAFPADGLKAALVLAILSTWVVISVFAYLNLQARKSYFRFWAVAWLYYSLYLADRVRVGRMAGLVTGCRLALRLYWHQRTLSVLGELQLAGQGGTIANWGWVWR